MDFFFVDVRVEYFFGRFWESPHSAKALSFFFHRQQGICEVGLPSTAARFLLSWLNCPHKQGSTSCLRPPEHL